MTHDLNLAPLLDGYVSRIQLSELLKVSTRTIARYENETDGLPHVTLGGRKLYRIESVRDWLRKRERYPNPRRHPDKSSKRGG